MKAGTTVLRRILSILILLIPFLISKAAAGPQVGMHYYTWFTDTSGYPSGWGGSSGACYTNAWNSSTSGTFYGPFFASPNSAKSILINSCYDSDDASIAAAHAYYLDEMGVDFVIFDVTNNSKLYSYSNDPEFMAARNAITASNGFKSYVPKRIKAIFQLSLTCWASNCLSGYSSYSGYSPYREVFMGRDIDGTGKTNGAYNSAIVSHIQEIANLYQADSSAFVRNPNDGNKPILLFYVGAGSNVYDSPYGTASLYFGGPGNLVPTSTQYDPPIVYNGVSTTMRNVFSVRFNINAASYFDYSSWSSDIWPFQCNNDCVTSETGYTALHFGGTTGRGMSRFTTAFNNASNKKFMEVRSWNEFSHTGDEAGANSYTIEPNSYLHTVDGSPGGNAYYNYRSIRATLQNSKQYHFVNKNSGKCLATTGSGNGQHLEQRTCNTSDSKQTFYVRAFGPENATWGVRYIVNAYSSQCADVAGDSLSNGGSIQQWSCTLDPQQIWTLGAYATHEYQIVGNHSGKCMDVISASTSDGAWIQQWDCSGALQQRWDMIRIDNPIPD